MLIAITAGCSL